MTPEDFAADLSGRLRRRGVDFRPKDIWNFAVNAPAELLSAPDVEASVERFIEANRERVERMNLARRGWRQLWEGLLLAAPTGACAAASVAAGLQLWTVPFLSEWGVDWIPMGVAFPLAALACGVGVINAVQGAATLARAAQRVR